MDAAFLLILIAFIFFLLAAFRSGWRTADFLALGLALYMLALLVGRGVF